MTKYIVEQVRQVVIDDDDVIEDGVTLTEALAVEIAREIHISEWAEVDFAVVGVQK